MVKAIEMVISGSLLVQGSSYAPAIFGLAGSLIGGFIAGTVSLFVARQARDAAVGAWIRDNRREIYDRYLTYAERLLHSCEAYRAARHGKRKAKSNVGRAFTNFWEVYGVLQTVAGTRLVEAGRTHAYLLGELAASLNSTAVIGPEDFIPVIGFIRKARHDMINAMRAELGLEGSVRPASELNPFAGTYLAAKYTEVKRNQPGPLTLWELRGRDLRGYRFWKNPARTDIRRGPSAPTPLHLRTSREPRKYGSQHRFCRFPSRYADAVTS